MGLLCRVHMVFVLVGKFAHLLNELAEALRYCGQLWEECFEAMHSHLFAASCILELMRFNLR